MSNQVPSVRPSIVMVAGLVFMLALSGCDAVSSPSASVASCGAEEVAGGGISGIVVDTEGNPLNDIFLHFRALDGFSGSARTGADGTFVAMGVAGEFQITTTDIDYDELVRRVSVPCGELVEIELILTPR